MPKKEREATLKKEKKVLQNVNLLILIAFKNLPNLVIISIS